MNEKLEKEIEIYFDGWTEDSEYGDAVKPDCYGCTIRDCKDIAEHFYNLALEEVKAELGQLIISAPISAPGHQQVYAYNTVINFINNLTK